MKILSITHAWRRESENINQNFKHSVAGKAYIVA